MNYLLQVFIGIMAVAGLSPASCTEQADIKSLLLTESTRGLQRSIKVTPEHTLVVVNDDSSRTVTSTGTWEALVKQVRAVPPAKLPDLNSGGTRHQVDAALQSQLVIETAEGTFSTPSFDHNQPPTELIELHQLLYKQIPADWKEKF